MVMADYGDRSMRLTRRIPRKYFEQEQEVELSPPATTASATTMTKVPKILSKSNMFAGGNNIVDSASLPGHDTGGEDRGGPPVDKPPPLATDKPPVLMVKNRTMETNARTSNHVLTNIPGLLAGDGPLQSQLHHVQSTVQTSSSSTHILPQTARLPSRAVKLVDETFVWCESGLDLLLEQTDFLVVGVLGVQGVGKSTVLSALAGSNITDSKSTVFERLGNRYDGTHKTFGIDMYITGERTILLDAQPVLSASVLDDIIHQDKKISLSATSVDNTSLDNTAELQSLQVATFMMTVCNVVVVVMDWFADVTLFKILQLAEMMKPSTPSTTSTANGLVTATDETTDYYPHIAFVLNRADATDFRPANVTKMQKVISQLMSQSKLKYTGLTAPSGVGVGAKSRLHRVARKVTQSSAAAANLFLLPEIGAANNTCTEEILRGYRGHREFGEHMRDMTHRLLSMPRQPLTHAALSEKNWFHYAARSWDVIRKSQLLAEYSRLQS